MIWQKLLLVQVAIQVQMLVKHPKEMVMMDLLVNLINNILILPDNIVKKKN